MPVETVCSNVRRLMILAVLLTCPTTWGQQFSVVDLGTLGGPMAGGFGINANRFVAGYSALPNASFHGFLWDGTLHDLAPLAGDTQSHSFAINALGQMTGVSYVLGGLTSHAVLWQQNASSYLGDFAPRGINDAGMVVGCASSAINGLGWVDRACIYSNGTLITLATLGGSFSYAYDVNGANQIVGMSYTTGEAGRHACLWQNNQPLDLGTLGGANSQACAINNAGQVVGVSDTSAGNPHAFLYTVNSSGQVTARADLGELGGGWSYAYGINGLGEVVGTSNSRAFYWKQGSPFDLNKRIPITSGWVLNSAMDINDNGEIVGLGWYHGWPHAFLLLPAAPDFDGDGDVDQEDFGHLQVCYSGTVSQTDPTCWNALLDGDDTVDANDVKVFEKCRSGPGVPAAANCWR